MNVDNDKREESSTTSQDIERAKRFGQEDQRQHDNLGSKSSVIAVVFSDEQSPDELPKDLIEIQAEETISEARILEALDAARADISTVGDLLQKGSNLHNKIRAEICFDAIRAIDAVRETVVECGELVTMKSPNCLPMIASRAALEFIGMRCACKVEAALIVVANCVVK